MDGLIICGLLLLIMMVLLTGGVSNVEPHRYGGGPSRVDNLLPREQDAVRRFFK